MLLNSLFDWLDLLHQLLGKNAMREQQFLKSSLWLLPAMPVAVPGSELDSISKTFSGLLSFSRSFKLSPTAPRWVGTVAGPAVDEQE